MTTDLVFLSFNRLAFTQRSFQSLLENTNWDLVRALYIYDDGSKDGTREWLGKQIGRVPVLVNYFDTRMDSPVRIMNQYLDQTIAEAFAKIDNDIVVPPGWLDMLLDVMGANSKLEILGFEVGMGEMPPCDDDPYIDMQCERTYLPARHIGGVGLMKVEPIMQKPRIRPNGRFGWTEHQHKYPYVCGWIQPDILVSDLSRIPVEPWASLSKTYVENSWQREWPKNDALRSCYWDWWVKG
jgi:glycosyltransferase involved in cell wall biosynthesis